VNAGSLKLGIPYPFTREYVNKAPFRTGVYTLLGAHQEPLAVDCGTLLNDMWRYANRLPKGAIKWFKIEKLDGTYSDMQDYVEVLRAAYGLVPREPARPKEKIGFTMPQ
jgi:hypothetical protein